MLRLQRIALIQATLRTRSDLHISSGREFHVRADQQTVKHHDTGIPYIPGSTLKGVMRAQLELAFGVAQWSRGEPLTLQAAHAANWPRGSLEILQLFGCKASRMPQFTATLGPSRCSFDNAEASPDWIAEQRRRNAPLTNRATITRTDRKTGMSNLKIDLEVVPAGAAFRFKVVLRQNEGDKTLEVLRYGLSLLADHGIGFGVSRGFGGVQFEDLQLDGEPLELPNIYQDVVGLSA
jgi:CRISPR-associated protein Csm3